MSILSRLKKVIIPSSAMVSITDLGHRCAESDRETGIAFAILAELDDHSPQSVAQLARSTRIDVFKVSRGVAKLVHQGKVSTTDFTE